MLGGFGLDTVGMQVIRVQRNSVPVSSWVVALSQLVSRICHKNEDIVIMLQEILADLLFVFPKQTMWSVRQLPAFVSVPFT